MNMRIVLCQYVKEKTVSLWSFVNDQRDKYLNPLYVHSVHQQHVLFPVASLRRIVPWTSYYLRWNPSTVLQVDYKVITATESNRNRNRTATSRNHMSIISSYWHFVSELYEAWWLTSWRPSDVVSITVWLPCGAGKILKKIKMGQGRLS